MEKFAGFKDKGVVAQHIARAQEMLKNYDACMEALDAIDPAAPANVSYDKRGTGELGFGVIEGPRGTDVHMAQVKEGKPNSTQQLYQLLGTFQPWVLQLKDSTMS